MRPLLFLLLFSCISFFSCREDCPTGDGPTYYLSEEDKSKVPYTGTDTLRFTRNGTDTFTFIGEGKETFFASGRGTYNDNCGYVQPERLEGYRIEYVCDDLTQKIILSLTIDGLVEYVTINFEDIFSNCALCLRKPYEFDSLIVNGEKYYNINKMFNTIGDPQDVAYYTVKDGIIRIKVNGMEWEILQ